MKLLRELSESVEYITEAPEGAAKNHFIQGIFMEADVVNRNGRVYDMNILRPEVERFNKDMVMEGRGFGELGHPPGPMMNLDRVCIVMKELKEDKNRFHGKAQVTNEGLGLIVRGLLEAGAKLGVSSRALGSLKEGTGNHRGAMMVQPDLKLIAVDVVADPSAPNAFVQGVMESAEWVQDPSGHWKVAECVEVVKRKVKKMNTRQINENKVKLFEDYLAVLTGKDI